MFTRFSFLQKMFCFGERVTAHITKQLHGQRRAVASAVSVLAIVALAVSGAGSPGTLTAFADTSVLAVVKTAGENHLLAGNSGIMSVSGEVTRDRKDLGVIAAAEKAVSIRHGQLVVGYLLTQNVIKQEKIQETAAAGYREIKDIEETRKKLKSELFFEGEDYQTLLRIVEAEAGICDSKGKILVANVVMNRVRSSEFPNTVREVVYQPSQFSPVSNGTINTCKVTSQTVECVKRALSGEDYSQGALYFMNRGASRSGAVRWFDGRLTYLFSYGGHEFFK